MPRKKGNYTPPKYPDQIPTLGDLPNRQDDVDWIYAARYNELKKELRAALIELGTNPAGNAADLKTRLAVTLDDDGVLRTDLTPTFAGLTIQANLGTPAVLINQAGAGDILNLQDGGNTVLQVLNTGQVALGTGALSHLQLKVFLDTNLAYAMATVSSIQTDYAGADAMTIVGGVYSANSLGDGSGVLNIYGFSGDVYVTTERTGQTNAYGARFTSESYKADTSHGGYFAAKNAKDYNYGGYFLTGGPAGVCWAVYGKDESTSGDEHGAGFFDGKVVVDGIVVATPGVNFIVGAGANYFEAKADGEIELHGTARVERHFIIDPGRFKKPGLNPPGDSFEDLFYTLDFDRNTEESAYCQEQIPFRWDPTTDIVVEIDWLHDSVDAGKVMWGLEYKSIKGGEAVAGAGTTITQLSAGNHAAGVLVRTVFTAKIVYGNLEQDDTMAIRLFRQAMNMADNLDEDARFINLHVHFIQNKFGKET